ncbi:MAG TPA: TetR/AcrR family transcriptional regulator [Anaeromyxobacter sp.]
MARTKTARDGLSAPDANPIIARRRAEIEKAAVDLFSESGYHQTTIDDIAGHLGIGKGLIYRYFKDKTDVLLRALTAVLEVYDRDDPNALWAKESALRALQWILLNLCAVSEEHPREVVLAYRSTKDLMREQRRHIKALENRIVADIRKRIEACVREGLLDAPNVRALAYQFVMYGHAWALKNWALRKDFTIAQYVGAGERLLVVPFLTEAGRRAYRPIAAAEIAAGLRAVRE